MEPGEVELPCRTDALEVWMDVANSEDSGVEVFRPVYPHSCGSSGVSGCSENEVASESGSETYTPSTMQRPGSHLKRSDRDVRDAASETCSDTSSTHENQHSAKTSRQSSSKSKAAEGRIRPELKPKVPAKPSTLTRARKTLTAGAKSEPNDGRWPFTSHKPATRSRATSAADPSRKSTSTAFNTTSSVSSATTRAINIADTSRRAGPSSLNLMTTSIHQNGANMASSFNGSTMHHSMTQSFGVGHSTDGQTSALEKYGTLPRRRKKDVGEATSPGVTRSNSREPSLNRAATLRRQQSREKDTPIGGTKSLPPYPRGRKPPSPKTIIFHEVSVQTALTAKDLDRPTPQRASGNSLDQSIQTEGDRLVSAEEVERLKKEQEEVLKRIQRVLGLDPGGNISVGLLYDLEKHVATVGRTVIKQREELQELRNFKAMANRNLEKSHSAQKALLHQLQSVESEQAELQEFLQAEKSTLSESLLDADDEISRLKGEVVAKTSELTEQQEQCKHLVRVCEQRRQENLSMEARLAGLEQRSRDVFRQQGAAVSGAAVALTSLGARLDSLVDQLALCYNVSDKDLEDVIFHNEAYSQSRDGSPDLPGDEAAEKVPVQSSARQKSSILSAVLNAIRSATQSPASSSTAEYLRRSSVPITPPDQSSESFNILDAELDPSLALDKSSMSGDSESCPLPPARSASLQNLSAAILQRQKTEEEEATTRFLDTGLPPDVNTLVDHVIHVDNLVTKLLKVMRIAQMENDACLDQLTDNRAELDERLRAESASRQESEDRLRCVKVELQDARSVLNNRIQQLEDAQRLLTESWRRESERQYTTIDHALETLQTMQDVVMQFPPLVKLQQQLEDCNFRTAAGDDLNANSPNNHELTNGSTVRTSNI